MIYVHVPFCRSFCTYCDFYSEIACKGRDAELFETYTEALCTEISRRMGDPGAVCNPHTLYIGGGTPSVLDLAQLRQIVDTLLLTGGVPPEPFTEFTVEVNPEDIVEKGPDYVRGLRDLGVNRISMGVQSLDDGILRWMNRRHDAARARQAVRILREAGVSNLSVDLIFGLSQLAEATLDATLDGILAWRPEHISAYQLSIEEGSTLGAWVRAGRYAEAPQEQCAAQYARICRRLRAAGYVHYEISNWALPGHEAVHNSAYWARRPYVGLGPGAHSFDGATRSWNPSDLDAWRRGARPESEHLTEAEAREERIFLGLRTAQGIAEGLVAPDQAAPLLADGRLVRTGGRLRIPEDHWFVSDDILADLI